MFPFSMIPGVAGMMGGLLGNSAGGAAAGGAAGNVGKMPNVGGLSMPGAGGGQNQQQQQIKPIGGPAGSDPLFADNSLLNNGFDILKAFGIGG